MQSSFEFVKSLTLPKHIYTEYKEVMVPNTLYSKLVSSDGRVAIIKTSTFGGGWSTSCYDGFQIKKQMIFDSRLVLYLISDEYKKYFRCRKPFPAESAEIFENLIKQLFQDKLYIRPDIDTFSKLHIEFVPENSKFRIVEYDGSESIEYLDETTYITA